MFKIMEDSLNTFSETNLIIKFFEPETIIENILNERPIPNKLKVVLSSFIQNKLIINLDKKELSVNFNIFSL